MKIEKIIVKISLYFTNTGFIPLSPLSSVMGAIYILMIGKVRIIYKVEFFILLFLMYVFISTLFFDPTSFFHYGYYRYDGNIWISYLPIFFFSFSPILLSINSLIKFIRISCYIYLVWIIIWYMKGLGITFGGLYAARNATGGFLSILTTASFILAFNKVKGFKIITLLLFIMLTLTYSRGSMLGFLVTAIISIFFYKRKILIDKLLFFVFFLLTLSIAIFFYNPKFSYVNNSVLSEYINSSTGTKKANLLTRAVYLWPKAIDMFIKSPLFGNGFGSYNDYGNKKQEKIFSPAHAHNSYLHFLAEMGIVGLLFFLYILIQIRKFWLRHRNNNMIIADISYFSLLAVVFASFTEHRITTPASMILVSILFGTFISHVRETKKINSKRIQN
jgi:O-antigen ligase